MIDPIAIGDFKAFIKQELMDRGFSAIQVESAIDLSFNEEDVGDKWSWTGGWYLEYTVVTPSSQSIKVKKSERRIINC